MAVSDDVRPTMAPAEYDRMPPQDLAAEQSVLGGMLLSKDAIADVVEILKAGDFYKPAHGTVFDSILDLYGRGEPADPVTVAASLADSGGLARIGGAAYLHDLISLVPTAANAGYYARIVAERAVLRRLIAAGTRIVQLGQGAASGQGRDVDDVVDMAQQAVYEVTERRTSEDYTVLEELLQPTMDEIEAIGAHGGVMSGVPTGFVDLDRLTNGFHPGQLIVVAARPGLGKCIGANTLVTAAGSGERLTVAEFVRRGRAGEDLRIHSLSDDWKLDVVRPSDFIPNGVRPVWRMTTRSGRSISATANHPMRTLNGWVPLEQLHLGDHVAVPRTVRVSGSGELPDALVALTAYLIGDGCLRRGAPELSAANKAIRADAELNGQRLGLRVSDVGFRVCADAQCTDGLQQQRADELQHRHPVALSFSGQSSRNNPLKEHLREVGLWGLGSADKHVPAAYFQLSTWQLRIFLSRLFATDGWACVSETKAGKALVQIGYCSISERLARDVQHLLLRFGLTADLSRKKVKYQGEHRWAWQVVLHQARQIERFCEEIGIVGKTDQLDRVYQACVSRKTHSNTDLLPREVWDLVLADKGALSWAEVSARCGRPRNHNWHVGKQGIGRDRLAELAKALDSQRLRDLAESDVLWDPIVSIEPDGEAEVYDLTIDGTHNFVANDIVVHNSTFGLDVSRSASIRHGLTAAIFSLEMSKIEITMRLLSAEAKVPLHHLRSGQLSEDDWTKLARRMGEVSEAPLYIDDSPNMTMMEIRAKARRLKQRHGLRLILLDYLQLMSSPKRVESRQQEVSELSRGLKLLAKELEVPVIAVSQLNRGPEQRTDKRPQLSDLRESGCLPASTRIVRADTGAEVTLGELMASGERDLPVWSLDEDLKYVPRRMTHVFSTGTKEVFRVRLASGKEVHATANHPLLTFTGWRPLGDLAVGARIAVPRHVSAPLCHRAWPDDDVVLLAHMIGDGSFVARQPIRYASTDEACLEVVSQAAAKFGVTPVRDEYAVARCTTLRLPAPERLTWGKRNPIAAWLDELGLFGLRSHEKFVPAPIFGLPKSQVRQFLRHLWSTDGCVWWDDKLGMARIYYASTSRRLIDGVSLLLLRFGINSRVRTISKAGYRDAYHLYISGGDDQWRFLRGVGVFGARNRQADRCMQGLEKRKRNTNRDTVPREVWTQVRRSLEASGLSQREFASRLSTKASVATMERVAPSRSRLSRIAEVLDDAALEIVATNDVFWDEITEIVSVGDQEVFDATVLKTHNFIADGVVVHNSIEQDADMVILLNREDYYEKESPRAGEADFIVAKHRNGPTDTITVAFQGHFSRFVDMSTGV